MTAPGTTPPALTEDEHEAMRLTAKLTNLMCRAVIGRGDSRYRDIEEFVAHIHAIQHTIMAQAAARAYPDQYRLLGEAFR